MTQRRIYQNEYPYFVTFRTRGSFVLFEDVEMARLLAGVVFNAGRLKRFDILAYQIMPDHMHMLVNKILKAQASLPALVRFNGCPHSNIQTSAPTEGCARGNFNISQFVHTIKSYYCDQIRDQHDINYPVFQKRFYDRIVDNQKYLEAVIYYIENNPIKEKLPAKYHQSPYQYFDWNKINNLFFS